MSPEGEFQEPLSIPPMCCSTELTFISAISGVIHERKMVRKEDLHLRVTVDQAESLCHRITLHFGRLNIETGAQYYCI